MRFNIADIELVIKIPEETYKNIQSRDWKNGELVFSDEWKAIHNGTILPKGHGRLIDADELKKHKYHDSNRHEKAVSVAQIDWQPTIIEADKERSE